MEKWKIINNVNPDANVFIVKGGYGDVKRALIARGWAENTDSNSPLFDLKWTLKSKHVDHDTLNSR